MIEPIRWHGNDNPFVTNNPLKITFHSSSLMSLSDEENEVLNALQELAYLPEIEALQTDLGLFPHIEIGTYDSSDFTFPLRIDYGNDRELYSGIYFPHNLDTFVDRYIEDESGEIDRKELLNDIIAAFAHRDLGQHILVTKSTHLLKYRHDSFLENANLCNLSEAARIVGLFLRSKNKYVYSASQHGERSMNKGFFCWILMRYHLPAMWHYFGACVYSQKERQKVNSDDDTFELGGSILNRAVRALQARDAIGMLFYSPQNNDTRDTMLYHLDYLTLLLTGAFDAQARIAYRAYGLTKPNTEKNVSFHKTGFLNNQNNPNLQNLLNIISSNYCENLLDILYTLRNTIHGAGLQSTLFVESQSTSTLVEIPSKYQDKLLDAAKQLSNPEIWGFVDKPGQLYLEPYTFVRTLLKECFNLLNKIADATDVLGLFPQGHPIPTLPTKPAKEDKIYGEQIGKRLSVLAW